jgi:hypothetical protein
MSTHVSNLQSVHLPDDAMVTWSEPYYQEAGDTWVATLEANDYPHGSIRLTFFGTEETVRKIVAGYQPAEEEADPDQIDALKPEPLSQRTDMVDLATRVVGLGGVASW